MTYLPSLLFNLFSTLSFVCLFCWSLLFLQLVSYKIVMASLEDPETRYYYLSLFYSYLPYGSVKFRIFLIIFSSISFSHAKLTAESPFPYQRCYSFYIFLNKIPRIQKTLKKIHDKRYNEINTTLVYKDMLNKYI